jgi:hypothetical protein
MPKTKFQEHPLYFSRWYKPKDGETDKARVTGVFLQHLKTLRSDYKERETIIFIDIKEPFLHS